MRSLFQTIAISDHWLPRKLRRSRRGLIGFSVPTPRVLTVPLRVSFLAIRSMYYFIARVCFCEPFFKSYCTTYGRNLHTGVFMHWIQGYGRLVIGNDVTVDGKCSFKFAARYSPNPTLIIGDRSGIGHNTSITIGDKVTIGRDCRIASGVTILDAPGHPLDPVARLEGRPAARDDVRAVVIEDNVWIGSHAIVMPGVTLGKGSVVATGSVVMNSVQPNVLVAGNPARQIRMLIGAGSTNQQTKEKIS